jgi:hypothetical protein
MAQPATPWQYPEVAWLDHSSYCNPYFGFRLALPAELKSERIFLPVQPQGRHMLLALRFQRLDRTSELFISAFEDRSQDAVPLAAKARVQQARASGLTTSGPNQFLLHDRPAYRLHITGDVAGPGSESSLYFAARGYVLHFAIFSHQPELAAAIVSAAEHLEFLEPGDAACAVPAVAAAPPVPPSASAASDTAAPDSSGTLSFPPLVNAGPQPSANPPRLYYGPALPTGLVDATLHELPSRTVPSGELSRDVFADPALGLRFVLPHRWQSLSPDEAGRVTELMRDPVADTESADRRRALFRACSRVIFAASDPAIEITVGVHPALAIAAMPMGCVPDMLPAATASDRTASEDFATALLRSTGVLLLARGHIHAAPEGRLTYHLDGTLPYQVPGEKLSRRLSLRLSATANGPWLIFIYSVTASPAEQRELESRITLGDPSPAR